MALGKLLIEQLKRLAQDGPQAANMRDGSEGHARIVAGTEQHSARLEFTDHDRYSVALLSLEVGSGMPAEADTRAYLSSRAAEIARRLSYLEEALAVWELDGSEAIAQLRSSPPQREEQELSYWEVVLKAGSQPSASIARYRWAPGMTEREQIQYPATFALVGRLTESLAAALTEIDDNR